MQAASSPNYSGPLTLGQACSLFSVVECSDAAFTRDGLRADVEYRDLGLAAASGGRIGAKHIRAIRPFEQPTGWHWHDMTGHFVFVLSGWITFRFAGKPEDIVVAAGGCLSQPAGVPHNVDRAIRRSRTDRDQHAGEATAPGISTVRRWQRSRARRSAARAHGRPCAAGRRTGRVAAPARGRRARRRRLAVVPWEIARADLRRQGIPAAAAVEGSGPSSPSASDVVIGGAWVTTQEILGGYLSRCWSACRSHWPSPTRASWRTPSIRWSCSCRSCRRSRSRRCSSSGSASASRPSC